MFNSPKNFGFFVRIEVNYLGITAAFKIEYLANNKGHALSGGERNRLQLARLIAQYDVGELVSAKGIAEGVSNSNWLVETTGRDSGGTRFILTLYERRIDYADLPYFLDLLDHFFGRGLFSAASYSNGGEKNYQEGYSRHVHKSEAKLRRLQI